MMEQSTTYSPAVNLHPYRLSDDGTLMLYNIKTSDSPAVNLHTHRLADDGTLILQHEDV
jgi:hypothetical protein